MCCRTWKAKEGGWGTGVAGGGGGDVRHGCWRRWARRCGAACVAVRAGGKGGGNGVGGSNVVAGGWQMGAVGGGGWWRGWEQWRRWGERRKKEERAGEKGRGVVGGDVWGLAAMMAGGGV
nr:protein FAM98B-like [Arachis hypogaea]